ncbi:hypothetical protein I350_05420 [Cryptococcus amylolentus CBS 6273]|uniref:GPI transamidase component PIG-S n=1 Tax=Cryptococcus amylolentus CBS 6273 TaxID=1296118 RepID=A0A1E3JVF8_9TREE|nr:hypothetical protein I350_05420 [Cryptococcus amylolentus CBS 6273]
MSRAAPRPPSALHEAVNPPPARRLATILSFPALFLLAIPFWWYTTSIVRLPLPESRIEHLSSTHLPTPHAQILFTADPSAFPASPPGRHQYETKEILQSLGREVTKGVDGIYARKPEKERDIRRWDFVYTEWAGDFGHSGRDAGGASASRAGGRPQLERPVFDLLKGKLINTPIVHYKIALINSILSVFPPNPPDLPLRALKYTPNITLSFVLLNEDATEGSYVRGWDIDQAIKDHFLAHLEPLRPVFNFAIESQILFHAPLSFEPHLGLIPEEEQNRAIDEGVEAVNSASATDATKGAEVEAFISETVDKRGERVWVIDEEQLKIFVNSEKWSLDSGSTNNPVLRFLLYVPSKQHRPMRLASPDSAKSFLLPQFGGVVVINPPETSAPAYHLSSPALTPAFHLFTQHLYSLLALPHLPYETNKLHIPPPSSPFHPQSISLQPLTPWQVHQVELARMRENAVEARKTLMGIVRLVRKIVEMKVGEGVRRMVSGAVSRLEEAQRTDGRDVLETFTLIRDAVTLSNRAFFDPSMMGLLYFPDEHKFAVYTPLFAPIAVPLILGLIKEFVAWKKGKSQQKHALQDEGKEAGGDLRPVEGDVNEEPKGVNGE